MYKYPQKKKGGLFTALPKVHLKGATGEGEGNSFFLN